MSDLIAAPILVHLTAAVLCVLCWKHVRVQRAIVLTASAAALAFAVAIFALHALPQEARITKLEVGGWAAPFGITLVVDPFSAIMVLLNALVGGASVLYGMGNIDERRQRWGYHALVQTMLAACAGAFTTGDLFNMYVWFEVMLMSSFVLLTLAGGRGQLEGAIKYVTLNLLSSTLFLVAVGLLYGIVGTLNMADIGERLIAYNNPKVESVIAALFIAAYGIKAGAFPLFFWLPASYHTTPMAISALFAGLLTKVGVYALIRVFTIIFVGDHSYTGTILMWMAGLTMLSGVLGAASQFDIRRILSFHIVSQIGYMLMGLAVSMVAGARAAALPVGSPERDVLQSAATLAMAGAIFYILHHIVVKANLFLIAGLIQRLTGHADLKRMGGLYRAHPLLGVLFLIPALSLSGIPILSGFWSKLTLVRAGVQAETWGIVACSLFVSVLTLYSMTKIWAEAFWKPSPTGHTGPIAAPEHEQPAGTRSFAAMLGPCIALAVVTLCIGALAGPAFRISERAAAVLVQREAYVRAVLPADYLEALRSGQPLPTDSSLITAVDPHGTLLHSTDLAPTLTPGLTPSLTPGLIR